MRWYDDEESFPDPEYGVFGWLYDNERTLKEATIPTPEVTLNKEGYITGMRNREAETSRNFNLYMIELYNKAVK